MTTQKTGSRSRYSRKNCWGSSYGSQKLLLGPSLTKKLAIDAVTAEKIAEAAVTHKPFGSEAVSTRKELLGKQ